MRKQSVAILILIATALTAFGDSIDDAEAKRRGVPVSQVQAENALAAEKRKTAELEKQIAAARKKLDELAGSAKPISPTAQIPAPPAQAAATKTAAPQFVRPEVVPDGVVRADDLFAKFPANVPPKGTKITVQGRYVHQKMGPALPPSKDERGRTVQSYMKYIYLMGTNQDPFNPLHLTCLVDKPGKLGNYGSIVRLSGIVSDINPGMDKVELTSCDSLEVIPLPPLPLDAQIVGNWWGQYPAPAWIRGEFQFKPDHTMTATFRQPDGAGGTIAGKWQSTGNGQENKITLTLERTDGPVDLEFVNDRIRVPSILPLYVLQGEDPFVSFMRHSGPPIKATLAQAQNQMLQWIRTNCLPAQQQTVLTEANKLIKDAAPKKGNFALTVDGQLTSSHKMTELCVSQDELFVLEFSDAQAKASDLDPGKTRGIVWGEVFKAGDNEIKIESITLDHEDSMDLTNFVKGKIVLRAITEGGIGTHTLFMVCGDKSIQYPLQYAVGLDSTTIEFTLSIYGRPKDGEPPAKHFGNQMAVFFFTADPDRRDSNIIVKLVNLTK